MKHVKCEVCKGKGHTTTAIAGDVHIAECKSCAGWGTVDIETLKVSSNKSFGKFGRIDLNGPFED